MAHSQLEGELIHLERIITHLTADSALGLAYWRSRIVKLGQRVNPTQSEIRRIGRLLKACDAIGMHSDLVRNRA
jgi:hypothetical protein